MTISAAGPRKFSSLKNLFEHPIKKQTDESEEKVITKTKVQELKERFEKKAAASPAAPIKQKQVKLLTPAVMVAPVANVSPPASDLASPAADLPVPNLSAAAAPPSSMGLLSPASASLANNNAEVPQEKKIAENYVQEILNDTIPFLKFDSIIHSHASWIDTRLLLEAVMNNFRCNDRDIELLRSFLTLIKAKKEVQLAAAGASNPQQLNTQIGGKQNIIIPAGKKGSMNGPTMLGNRYIRELLEASVQHFNEDEAMRILDNYKWNIENLEQLVKNKIKSCEDSKINLMEFIQKMYLRFENNLNQDHLAIINELILRGLSGTNPRVKALSSLISRKLTKRLNFQQTPVLLETPGLDYASIKRKIVKNRGYDAELELIATDLKNKAICLFKAIPETEFLAHPSEQSNIAHMQFHSQKITNFVTTELLGCEDPKHRARLYRFFLRLCEVSSRNNDLHSVQALVNAIIGPVDRLHLTKAKLAESKTDRKLMQNVGEISQLFMLSFQKQKDAIQQRLEANRGCVPHVLLFMNGWANASEFNKTKFIPETYVPDPNRTSVITNLQTFFSASQRQFPAFRFQPKTNVAQLVEEQLPHDKAKELEYYKRACDLEPKSAVKS